MKNIRQPPMIHHCNQTEYIQRGANLVQMAADACAAMYLPDRIKKLLTFYADCPDGFFPALKTVHDATGMDRKDIYKARKELVDVGFTLYTPEEIRIDSITRKSSGASQRMRNKPAFMTSLKNRKLRN